MKKINSSGFVMAETLVVTVFLTVIFAMLYSSFLPLSGEYEKREKYDNIDGKYAVFWIKRMIEDATYKIPNTSDTSTNLIKDRGFVRFECKDIMGDDEKHALCVNLVKVLQVAGCDNDGNGCEIYITRYRLDNDTDTSRTWFKQVVKAKMMKYEEKCVGNGCRESYINTCMNGNSQARSNCEKEADTKLFKTGFKDYLFFLPDYTADSLNYANYRVIATFYNTKDNNRYYSYATIEVSR